MAEDQEIYRVSEVAKLLDVTPWTVRQWIEHGKVKAHKVGREWRVRYEEVARLLGRQPEEPTLLGFINEQLGGPMGD
jgi:putative resolvase